MEVRREPRRISPNSSFTIVTQTFGPNGTIITRRVTSHGSRNNENYVRAQPQSFLDSLFGMPFGGMGGVRLVSLDDIIEMSMRDAGNLGVPPASDEAIANLEEVTFNKDESHQCPVCMEDINGKGLKLPCGHTFDKECATTWLRQHDSCPVCRKSIQSNSNEQTN